MQIENDASGYAIGGVLNQLTSDQMILDFESILTKSNFSQCHPVAYFSGKMILAKT